MFSKKQLLLQLLLAECYIMHQCEVTETFQQALISTHSAVDDLSVHDSLLCQILKN